MHDPVGAAIGTGVALQDAAVEVADFPGRDGDGHAVLAGRLDADLLVGLAHPVDRGIAAAGRRHGKTGRAAVGNRLQVTGPRGGRDRAARQGLERPAERRGLEVGCVVGELHAHIGDGDALFDVNRQRNGGAVGVIQILVGGAVGQQRRICPAFLAEHDNRGLRIARNHRPAKCVAERALIDQREFARHGAARRATQHREALDRPGLGVGEFDRQARVVEVDQLVEAGRGIDGQGQAAAGRGLAGVVAEHRNAVDRAEIKAVNHRKQPFAAKQHVGGGGLQDRDGAAGRDGNQHKPAVAAIRRCVPAQIDRPVANRRAGAARRRHFDAHGEIGRIGGFRLGGAAQAAPRAAAIAELAVGDRPRAAGAGRQGPVGQAATAEIVVQGLAAGRQADQGIPRVARKGVRGGWQLPRKTGEPGR